MGSLGSFFARRLMAAAALGVMAAVQPAAAGQWQPIDSSDTRRPVLILADEVSHDEARETVTARGNVEITQGDRTLLTDQLTYDERSGIVRAAGNVVLLEPSGDVLFADHVELTEDLREGVIEQLRVLLRDRSRFAAVGGERTGGNRTVMYRGIYSPCELCADDPSRPPLWQLKAERIIHDETTQDVEYRDARLELFGVPVFYTPYFSHPDPTVEQRSGFLAPTFGHDSDLGFTAQIPYYFAIAPNADLTVAPIFMTGDGPVLTGEYRRRFGNGLIEVEGSAGLLDRTDVDSAGNEWTRKDRLRGHLKANAGFDIDENWRTRLQIHRASDDTYLRKLDLDNSPTLRSEAVAEYFTARSYGNVSGLLVQELRRDVDEDVTPVVLPNASFHHVSRPGELGFWTVRANALALHRDDGPESRRLSVTGGWTLPHTTEGGHLLSVSLSARGDLYSVERVPVDGRLKDGVTGRFVPMAIGSWRYPLARTGPEGNWIVEPMASVVIAPDDPNPEKIPNEDSQNVDFDDLNLFDPNRFPGLDRVEGGQRINYGFRTVYYGLDGGTGELFLGQSLRASRVEEFPDGSGLEGYLSDVVGRLLVSPADWLDLLYRFRIDKDHLDLARSEVGFRVGEPWLQVAGQYIQLDSNAVETDLFGRREQVRATVSSQFSRHWSGFAGTWYDIEEKDPLRHEFGLRYADECLVFLATYTKDFTSDREIEPDERVLFRLVFKNLGAFGIGQSVE